MPTLLLKPVIRTTKLDGKLITVALDDAAVYVRDAGKRKWRAMGIAHIAAYAVEVTGAPSAPVSEETMGDTTREETPPEPVAVVLGEPAKRKRRARAGEPSTPEHVAALIAEGNAGAQEDLAALPVQPAQPARTRRSKCPRCATLTFARQGAAHDTDAGARCAPAAVTP